MGYIRVQTSSNEKKEKNVQNDEYIPQIEFTKGVKRLFSLQSMGSKMILLLIVIGLLLYFTTIYILSENLRNVAYTITLAREKSDISYLEDLIRKRTTTDSKAGWEIKNGCLCYGGVVIGDGTEENAYFTPFFETEVKTGSFCYAFMKVSDDGLNGEGLKWIGDKKTGFQEGHYVRAAGSTRGTHGESIVGTYIDKEIADILDDKGEYQGISKVSKNNSTIYSYYKLLKNENKETVGCIVVGRGLAEIDEVSQDARQDAQSMSTTIIFVSIVILFMIINSWIKTLYNINKHVDIVSKGQFPEHELKISSNDEIGELAHNINNMVSSLKEKERMRSELNVAQNIQASMLPSKFPAFPDIKNIDLHANMVPAKEVGGDFYDFFKVDDDHIAFLIADVSGKGVPAALFMAITKTLIKNYAQIGKSPAEVFKVVNNTLLEDDRAQLFVTAWMAILNVKTGKLSYANAGHNPALFYTEEKGYEYLKTPPGLVLVGMQDFNYKSFEIQMKPGDRLFLYTDGVTEANDKDNNLYGEDRLKNCLNNHKGDTSEKLIQDVKDDIAQFIGEMEQFDDTTMLSIKFN